MASINIEKLIAEVKKHEVLYNQENPEYKDHRKKDRIFDTEISASMDGVKGDILFKKWRNLRDNYSKHLRSIKTTTGQGVNDISNKNLIKYKKWQWAPQMEFLKPFLKTASTLSNIPPPREIDTENQNSEDAIHAELHVENTVSPVVAQTTQPSTSILQNTPPYTQVQKTKKRSHAQVELEDRPNTGFNRILSYFKEKEGKKQKMNATEHTFMGWAKTVDKLSTRRKVLLQLKIGQLVAEAELQELEEIEEAQKKNTENPEVYNLQPMESMQNIDSWTDNHVYAPSCSNYELNSQNEKQEEIMPIDFSKEVPFQKY